MSKNVEERIVQMTFDNKDFEQNAKTTMETLDKLDKSLSFKDNVSSLSMLKSAISKISFQPMENGVNNVAVKFSAMQVMALTALDDIANAAWRKGKEIANALTIEPISTGLSEYETKINAIQVIQSNTRGKNTMDDITKSLDELNTYADKTIYNFAQMTSNIGKFVAQGLDVYEATNAVKGMANLAAASGASAADMSRATYQMSQALGSVIRKQDWNSLRNANMATVDLKNTIIAVAENQGIAVSEMIKAKGNFEDTLENAWLSGSIFTEAMNMYSGIYDEATLKSKGYSEEQIANFIDLAKSAESAATEVKTLSQLWDVLKETAQSGWTQSWEYIIGDFETAKKDLTQLQIFLSDKLNASAQLRNDVLQSWNEAGGRDMLIQSLKNLYDAIMTYADPIKKGLQTAFPPITADTLLQISKSIEIFTGTLKLGGDNQTNLRRIFDDLASSTKNLYKAACSYIKPISEALVEFIPDDLLVSVEQVTNAIKNFTGAISATEEQQKQIKNIATGALDAVSIVVSFVCEVVKGFNTLINGNGANIAQTFLNVIETIALWSSSLKDAIDSSDVFAKSISGIVAAITLLINSISGTLISFVNMLSCIFETIGGFFDGIVQIILALVTKFNGAIGMAFDAMIAIFQGTANAIRLGDIQLIIDIINGGILATILANVKKLSDSAVVFGDSLGKLLNVFKGFGSEARSTSGSISGIFTELTKVLEAMQTKLKAEAMIEIAIAVAILAGSIIAISMIDETKLDGAISAISVMMLSLVGVFEAMVKMSEGTKITRLLGMQLILGPLIAMCIATLILAQTLKTLAVIDEDRLNTAVVGMITIIASLRVMAKALNGVKIKMTSAASLILLSYAVSIVIDAIIPLTKIPFDEGVLTAVILLTDIVMCMSILGLVFDRIKIKLTSAASILIMSYAISIMADVTNKLARMSLKGSINAARSLAIIVGSLVAMSFVLNNVKIKITTLAMLILLANVIDIMAGVLKTLSGFDNLSQMLISVYALAAIVAVLAAASITLGRVKIRVTTIATLAVLSLVIDKMADIIIKLGKSGMDYDNAIVAISCMGAIVISLGILGLALHKVKVSPVSAASLLILSYAIDVVGDVLVKVSKIPTDHLLESVLCLTLIVVELGLLGAVLHKVKVKPVSSASLVILAYAIDMLSDVLIKLSRANLNEDNTLWSVIALTAIVAELSILGLSLNKVKVKPVSAASLVILAYAVSLLIDCFVVLTEVAKSGGDVLDGMLLLSAILTELALVGVILDKKTIKIRTAVSMIAMAYAVQMIVEALIPLKNMVSPELGIAIAALGGILLELAIALALIPKTSPAKALGVIEIAYALSKLLPVLNVFREFSNEDIYRSLGMLGGVLLGFTISLSMIPASAPVKALGIVMIIGSLYLLVPLIEKLGQAPLESVAQGIGLLLGVFVAIAYGATILANTGTALYSAALGIIVFSASLAVFGIALGVLATGISAIAISLVTASVSIGGIIIGFFTGFSDGLAALCDSLKKALVSILKIFIDIMPELANLVNALVKMLIDILVDNIPYITNGILTSIDETLKALVDFAPSIVTNLIKVIDIILDLLAQNAYELTSKLLDIVDGIFKAVGDELAKTSPDKIAQGVEVFALCAGLMWISASVVGLTGAAMKGVIAIGLIIGEITCIIAILGELVNRTGAMDIVQKGIDLLVMLSNGLGKCLGELIAGFVDGLAIPDLVDNMKKLGEGIKEFSDSIKDIPDNFMDKADIVLNAVGKILGTNFKSKVGSWFGGQGIGDTMEEALPKLASALFKFSDSTKELDDSIITKVERAITALDAMVELADHIPGQGGLTMLITGNDTLKSFGESMIDFGESVQTFGKKMEGVTESEIDKISLLGTAMTAMAEFTNNIPSTGGLAGLLGGNINIDDFGEGLIPLGEGIKGFTDSVSGLDDDAVTKIEASTDAVKALVDMSVVIPKTGGLVGIFGGDNDFAAFGKKMTSFGESIVSYCNSLSDISAHQLDKITLSSVAAQSIVDVANTIGNTGGLGSIFTGDNDLTAFSKKLPVFARAISQYAGEVKSISDESLTAVDKSVTAAGYLVDLANRLPETGGLFGVFAGGQMNLSQFSSNLIAFGNGMLCYAASVADIDDDKLAAMDRAVSAASAISDMAQNLPSDSGIFGFFTGNNDLDTFGKNLKKFGKCIHSYASSVSLIDEDGAAAVDKSVELATGIVELCKTLPQDHGVIGWFTGDNDLDTFANNLKDFGFAMKSYAESVSGLDSDTTAAILNANIVAEGVIALCDILPTDSGFMGFFKGNNDLDTFSRNLETFGWAMQSYSDSVKDIDPEVTSASISTAHSLVTICNRFTSANIQDFDGESTKNALANIGLGIKNFYVACAGTENETLSLLIDSCYAFIDFITQFITVDMESFKSSVDTLNSIDTISTDAIFSFAEAFANGIPDVVPAINSFVEGSVSALNQDFIDNVSAIDDNLTAVLEESVKSAGDNASKDAKTIGNKISTNVGSGIRDNSSKATNEASNVSRNIKTNLNNVVSSAYDVGKYISIGLANGINDYASQAISAADKMVTEVNTRMQKVAEVKSPSRFTMWIGEMYIAGLVKSLLMFAHIATEAATSVTEETNDAFELGIGDIYSSNMNFTPTITPVLDLSRIESGLETMSRMFNNPTIDTVGFEFNYAMEQQKVNQLNKLVDLCDKLVSISGGSSEITIDGKKLIGYVNRGLGGLA